mmetsp:Transcript_34764/g.79307  ORF Transcript_34764/g.79307 Transcript_34764/m.79307 type:complete len:157 (-) Transcript_34764:750-1220(-)
MCLSASHPYVPFFAPGLATFSTVLLRGLVFPFRVSWTLFTDKPPVRCQHALLLLVSFVWDLCLFLRGHDLVGARLQSFFSGEDFEPDKRELFQSVDILFPFIYVPTSTAVESSQSEEPVQNQAFTEVPGFIKVFKGMSGSRVRWSRLSCPGLIGPL